MTSGKHTQSREADTPEIYRFTLGPAKGSVVAIKWEISKLDEVVTGQTDGNRCRFTDRSCSRIERGVVCEGIAALRYSVYRDRKLVGSGRMFLVDDGKAWVDLTWPKDRQDLASELVYKRK